MKQPNHAARIHFAIQLYDTAQPPLGIREATRLAGLKHPALYNALKRRALAQEMLCPTCGLVPGQKLSLKRAKARKDQAARQEAGGTSPQ